MRIGWYVMKLLLCLRGGLVIILCDLVILVFVFTWILVIIEFGS